MPSIDDNAKKINKLLRKRQAKTAAVLGRELGYCDGRSVSRPLALLVSAGTAVLTREGYLKA